MASLFNLLNRLLPFATPGTPLLQDLVHLGAICTVLYYAPQIQNWAQQRQNEHGTPNQGLVDDAGQPTHAPGPANDHDQEPLDVPVENNHAQEREPVDDPEEQEDDNPGDANANAVEGEAGPANPPNIPNTPAHRNVGAKKAKSLARKDQKRAYNEFMRSQGEAQRAQEAEGAAEREAALAVEKERRRAAAAAYEAKKAKEREQKRELERKQREEEIKSRELAMSLVRDALDEEGMCDLFKVAKQVGGDADEEWVERILRASDVVGTKDGVLTMITSVGWAVRVSQQDVRQLYENAAMQDVSDESGAFSYDQLGSMFETILRERAVAA
ncbi:hypothetical protein Q7P37_010477 [Cladosporium fusiforme]